MLTSAKYGINIDTWNAIYGKNAIYREERKYDIQLTGGNGKTRNQKYRYIKCN